MWRPEGSPRWNHRSTFDLNNWRPRRRQKLSWKEWANVRTKNYRKMKKILLFIQKLNMYHKHNHTHTHAPCKDTIYTITRTHAHTHTCNQKEVFTLSHTALPLNTEDACVFVSTLPIARVSESRTGTRVWPISSFCFSTSLWGFGRVKRGKRKDEIGKKKDGEMGRGREGKRERQKKERERGRRRVDVLCIVLLFCCFVFCVLFVVCCLSCRCNIL